MSKRWLRGRKKDYYYKKAKEERYRSRAAFKLKQLNEKFKVIKKGDRVLDLGAAPGGWMQVALEIVGREGFVVGIDLEDIAPLEHENIRCFKGDMTQEETLNKIKSTIGRVDVIISDASPKISGVWSIDHHRSMDLCNSALNFAKALLRPGGNFLVKVFQGEALDEFLTRVKKEFRYTKTAKPMASRSRSAEMYVVGKGFLGNGIVKHLSE